MVSLGLSKKIYVKIRRKRKNIFEDTQKMPQLRSTAIPRCQKTKEGEMMDLGPAKDPTQGRNFVHYDLPKQHYIINKMTHVSPLAMECLCLTAMLPTLPSKQ